MKITQEEILHIARLSRLRFTDDELAEIGEHMEHILDRFATLDSVDTSGVAPTAHILPYTNVLRPDVPEAPMDREKLMQNAPEVDGGAYVVRRVVE